jgi:transcriptional regulator with XRE-family HTH domain
VETAAGPELSFAGLLRQLRAEARLTQEELAEAAGVSPRSVSDLERGVNRTARKDTALLLADALSLAGPAHGLFAAAARGKARASEVLAARQEVARGTFAGATRALPREIAATTTRRSPSPVTSAYPWNKPAPWKGSASPTSQMPYRAGPPRTCGWHSRFTSASAPRLPCTSTRPSKGSGCHPPPRSLTHRLPSEKTIGRALQLPPGSGQSGGNLGMRADSHFIWRGGRMA